MLEQTGGLSSGDDFPLGLTKVRYKATDLSGNSRRCTFRVNVVDKEKTSITCPTNIKVSTDKGKCSAVVSYPTPDIEDNCGEAAVERTEGPSSGDEFPVGLTRVTYKATDKSGRIKVCSFNVHVIDNKQPSITCPDDMGLSTDNGKCSAAASYSNPVIGDNCEGVQFRRIGGLSSGDDFPLGSTEVTYEATDQSGNSKVCSFNVHVVDDKQPIITCPHDVEVPTDEGMCTATVSYPDPAIDDNCGKAEFQRIDGIPSGDAFPMGLTTVSFEASDNAGNQKVCSFNVKVVNEPNITCPPDKEVPTEKGKCTANVSYPDPTIDNNCGGETSLQHIGGKPSGAIFSRGTTTVTFLATDASGNSQTCSFNVTVVDDEAPVPECGEGVNPAGNTPNSQNPDGFFVLTATDNCDDGTEALVLGVADLGPDNVIGTLDDYIFPAEFDNLDNFKYRQAPGAPPQVQPGSGDVRWKLTGKGDAYVWAKDEHGNIGTQLCPPVPPYRRHLRHILWNQHKL